MAVLRACAAVMVVLASACPDSGESARQKISGDESVVFVPQVPTEPTTVEGVPDAHSCPKALPISTKSPR